MKHLKTFEKYKEPSEKDPKIGDYVICNDTDEDLSYFLENNIGQIVDDISSDLATFRTYIVKYNKIPRKLSKLCFNGKLTKWDHEILYHNKNKEKLEELLITKKYNL